MYFRLFTSLTEDMLWKQTGQNLKIDRWMKKTMLSLHLAVSPPWFIKKMSNQRIHVESESVAKYLPILPYSKMLRGKLSDKWNCIENNGIFFAFQFKNRTLDNILELVKRYMFCNPPIYTCRWYSNSFYFRDVFPTERHSRHLTVCV